jgi:flavorubredoxin
MSKALIVYATLSGETRSIGELIAEGLRFTGCEATLKDANEVSKQEDLEGFDAYVFGSATYHGQMMKPMKTMLFLADKIDLEGKVGGSFGAFGWSGEAADRIYETMENILKMSMVGAPLRLKAASLGGGVQMAQDYGREIGTRLNKTE